MRPYWALNPMTVISVTERGERLRHRDTQGRRLWNEEGWTWSKAEAGQGKLTTASSHQKPRGGR